jgi:hypothetical protein
MVLRDKVGKRNPNSSLVDEIYKTGFLFFVFDEGFRSEQLYSLIYR